MVIGLFAGLTIALTDYKAYDRTIIQFSWYFAIACLVIIALFFVALGYAFVFPSKFENYCQDEDNNCNASTFQTIFGTISAFLLAILWFTFMLFYVDILSRIVINLSMLYKDTLSLTGLPRHSVKFAFWFRSKWRHVRYWFAEHTGCRVDDCCFGDCCGNRDREANRRKREERRRKYQQKNQSSSSSSSSRYNDPYYDDPLCIDCCFELCHACIRICCGM